MAVTPTLYASNTTSPTVTTETFLSSPNVAGVYTFHIDTVNMVAGDVLVVRIYQIVLTGGTTRVAYIASYSGTQPADDLIKISVPIGNDLTDTNSLRFSITQTFGTSRAFPWKVLAY
jgi:hypothetical protein